MYQQLIKDIEAAIKRRPSTPKDFEQLSERIFMRLNEHLSATTLMRLWGYLPEKVEPRQSTLDILVRFLGYRDLEDYNLRRAATLSKESDPVMSRRLNVPEELKKGDRVLLTWHPDRTCEIEYLGDLKFEVLESENTRLKPGDTFQCSLIIENEPLYIDNLKQNRFVSTAYVCGKKTGVRFERVMFEDFD